MVQALIVRPDASQMAAYEHAYGDAIRQKRMRFLLGMACLILAILTASWGAEVNLATLWNKAGHVTTYFNRLFFLDNGQRVWTDFAEWFWGLKKWSRQLGETLLMAYVATITGAIAAGKVRGRAPSTHLLAMVYLSCNLSELGSIYLTK